MKHNYKNCMLFLLIAFLLPFLSILAQSMISNKVIRFLFYGIQAASPSIAAIIVLYINQEWKKFFVEKFHRDHLLSAVLLPVVIACVPMFFAKLIGSILVQGNFVLGSISSIQFVVIVWAFVAEELGWRGYLEPLLKKSNIHSGFVPCILGIIWCLWHYHYFLQNGVQVPILLFLGSCIIESYLYSFLLYQTNNNIISAMMYHFSWNLFLHLFAVNPIDNHGSIIPYIVLVILEVLMLLLFLVCSIIIRKRKNE